MRPTDMEIINKGDIVVRVVNDIQLAKNFKLSEFKCRHCDKVLMPDMRLVEKLQQLRDLLGKSIKVSGYRCPEYNKQLVNNPTLNASPTSKHMQGIAADITSNGVSPEEMCYLAKKVGFPAIRIYDGHVHVDVRDVPSFIDYRQKNKGKKFTTTI